MAAYWSESETALLREMSPTVPPVRLAVKLKRPMKAILEKQRRLGLMVRKEWA